MRIRLYLDEDAMDEDLVYGVRLRGVDVMTARDSSYGVSVFAHKIYGTAIVEKLVNSRIK